RGVTSAIGGGGAIHGVVDEGQQNAGDVIRVAGVAGDHRHGSGEFESGADLLGVVGVRPVELVDRDDEGQADVLEEADGREAALQAAGIDQDDRAVGAAGEGVPEDYE